MKRKKLIFRIVGVLSATAGISLLLYTFLPMAKYALVARARFYTYISPVPQGQPKLLSIEETEGVDYTNANNWFAGGIPEGATESKISHYTISVPRLGIENATVALGGEDLSESLIQYPGTALPGKKGNAVLFGHSILPQFFNAEDYLSIFSLLPELEPGDEIQVNFDGIAYKYVIEDMFEVRPTDVYILDQVDDEPYLSLVTCTPPGHPLRPKRLVVKAKIVDTSLSGLVTK